eukprot:TRINITY_DN55254_c0_g1_i1.p1 TRINITY_DN55254_c0_g1~~TRINITY_DN55254_c0_g1_i1.p1  ORF type:complete len:256 (-),score=38.58 TRINITY_DN55254_c0_g1_i1:31-798(-)
MRTGAPCPHFWNEVVDKETRWDRKGLYGRGYIENSLMHSDGVDASLGNDFHTEGGGAPGEAAAIEEAMRHALALRRIAMVKQDRHMREAAYADRAGVHNGGAPTSATPSSARTPVLPVSPPLAGLGDVPAVAPPTAPSVGPAVRTNPVYMSQSPTYRQTGDIRWFTCGTGGNRKRGSVQSRSLAAAGASATGGTPTDSSGLVPLSSRAAGASLEEIHAARDASRVHRMRARSTGDKYLRQMRSNEDTAKQLGGPL